MFVSIYVIFFSFSLSNWFICRINEFKVYIIKFYIKGLHGRTLEKLVRYWNSVFYKDHTRTLFHL